MISAETVRETWQRIGDASASEARRLSKQMQAEQPTVMAYLLALDGEPFNRHETEILFYIGTVLWQMMRQSETRLRRVSAAHLQQAETDNLAFLETLGSDTSGDFFTAVQRMLQDYPEPEVLGYLIEALNEDDADPDPDDPPIRDDYRGLAFLYLKTVLDALIRSQGPPTGQLRSPI